MFDESSLKRLFFLAVGMFSLGCEDYLFAGLLPGVSVSLKTSVVAAAQGCTAFGLAYVVSAGLCVFLLSKISTRHVLILALVIFLTGNFATVMAPNLLIYIVSRFIAGLGSGLFLPIAVGTGVQITASGFEGRALSLMWAANSIGAVVGVPIGLWLASQFGWRTPVLLILALAVLALIGLILQKERVHVDVQPPSLQDQLRLLINPRVIAVISVTILTATGCLGLYTYISQVLSGTDNSSDVAFSLWSIGGLIGSSTIGFFLDRTSKPQTPMLIILATLLITIASIPIIRWIPNLGLVPFLIWGAMGWASVTPQQYNLIQIKPGHESILVALNSSAVSFGGAIGTALGGIALNHGISAGSLPYVTSVFVLCALVWQIFLARSARDNQRRAD